MRGYINGYDWLNVKAMKYWSFSPKTSIDTRKDVVKNAIFGGEYMGALKVDGYYERILKDEDGNIFMIARELNSKGEVVDKHEWVPHLNPWFDSLPNGTCLLCECYLPGNEGSKKVTSVLGCLKEKAIDRQKAAPLHLYVFDCMALAGENFHKNGYLSRSAHVIDMSDIFTSPYVEYAKYYDKKELWDHLQQYLDSGREGMVIMRKDAIVYNKRTPARISIKVKKALQQTIDCFFTGAASAPTKEYTGKEVETWPYWEDLVSGELYNECKIKDYRKGAPVIPVTKNYYHNWAGSMQIAVVKDGKVFPIGWLSGITDEMRADPKDFAGKVVEVTAMEYDPVAHTLRHGKIAKWRPDLSVKDCTFDKI